LWRGRLQIFMNPFGGIGKFGQARWLQAAGNVFTEEENDKEECGQSGCFLEPAGKEGKEQQNVDI